MPLAGMSTMLLSSAAGQFGSRLDCRRTNMSQKSPLPGRSTSILKLNECQHFHYDYVELGPVTVQLITDENELLAETHFDPVTFQWTFSVESNSKKWQICRTFVELSEFDCQLHRCVFDRRHSRLTELRQLRVATAPSTNAPLASTSVIVSELSFESPPSPAYSSSSTNASTTTAALSWTSNSPIKIRCHLAAYVDRLSQLTGSIITCFPVLKFLELDSRGNHFVPIEQSQINTPAIAAAIVVREFEATKPDELSLKVGDIVSVIEMKTLDQSDNIFWKGKLTISKVRPLLLRGSRMSLPANEVASASGQSHQFIMGYFPSTCVKLFSGKIETDEYPSSSKRPVNSRSFINRQNVWKMRPRLLRSSFWGSPRPKQNDMVFGTDLVEYLARTNLEVPIVLTACVKVLETYGLVTGIYRQCGIQSNIRRLRWEFDNGHPPDLADPKILRDIHCVSSLLKQYFRQLPNPLFTYELYADVLRAYESEPKERVANVRKVVRQLPPAHYRTARTLMYHLLRMSRHKSLTDMTASNLAIVWAPNLFRNPPSDDFDGQLLRGITIHKSLCNFLIVHAYAVFEDSDDCTLLSSLAEDEVAAEMNDYLRHKEDNAREYRLPVNRACIDVNGGPAMLPAAFHTVIELPHGKENVSKWKKLLKYSSLEHSMSGFWNRRKNSLAASRSNTLSDNGPMSSSVTESGMRRSASVFSYVTRNVEGLGQNVIRSVRNFSVRKSRRWRRNTTEVGGTASATDHFEILPTPVQDGNVFLTRMTRSSEGGTVFDDAGSKATTAPESVKEKTDSLSKQSRQGPTLSDSDSNTVRVVEKVLNAKQKRVMFENSSRAEQIYYTVDPSSVHDESEGSECEDEERLSTDISSVESFPLDVSRYDNVSLQKSAESLGERKTFKTVGNTIVSPPSIYEDVVNLVPSEGAKLSEHSR